MASILVVDDDPAVRMTIKLVLERDGHAVALAANGFAGMKAIEAGDIHGGQYAGRVRCGAVSCHPCLSGGTDVHRTTVRGGNDGDLARRRSGG